MTPPAVVVQQPLGCTGEEDQEEIKQRRVIGPKTPPPLMASPKNPSEPAITGVVNENIIPVAIISPTIPITPSMTTTIPISPLSPSLTASNSSFITSSSSSSKPKEQLLEKGEGPMELDKQQQELHELPWKPCLIHTPTIAELQSQSFSDYVRHTVLQAAHPFNNEDDNRSSSDDEEEDEQCNMGSSDHNDNSSNHKNKKQRRRERGDPPPSTLTRSTRSTRNNRHEGDDDDDGVHRDNDTTDTIAAAASAPVTHYRHGMAKVKLPHGFLQSNSIQESHVIATPVKQYVRGLAGIYSYLLMDAPACTVSEFRAIAQAYQDDMFASAPWQRQQQRKTNRLRSQQETAVANKNQEERLSSSSNRSNISFNDSSQPSEPDDTTNHNTPLPTPACPTSYPTITELERFFWKRLGPTMPPPLYGADQEGTLFNIDINNDADHNNCSASSSSSNSWALDQLDSCVHVLSGSGSRGGSSTSSSLPSSSSLLQGVTSPYLYYGMWASVFCVHAEDMNLLSINYLHTGAPKVWYSIPSQYAARLQAFAVQSFALLESSSKNSSNNNKSSSSSSSFAASSAASYFCPEFLRHKQSLISPYVLLHKAGIPVSCMVQYPGEAMITFPGAYHFGFNSGFNIAEATNFGVYEWLPWGLQARVCLCRPDSVRIDMPYLIRQLQRYYTTSNKNKKQYHHLSWKAWARSEQQKQNQKVLQQRKQQTNKELEDGHDDDDEKKVQPSPHRRHKEFWIEVMKPVAGSVSASSSGYSLREGEEDTGDDEQCFLGRVVNQADNAHQQPHVRVHLTGLGTADDVWISVDSPKLFIDGGPWIEQEDEEEEE